MSTGFVANMQNVLLIPTLTPHLCRRQMMTRNGEGLHEKKTRRKKRKYLVFMLKFHLQQHIFKLKIQFAYFSNENTSISMNQKNIPGIHSLHENPLYFQNIYFSIALVQLQYFLIQAPILHFNFHSSSSSILLLSLKLTKDGLKTD